MKNAGKSFLFNLILVLLVFLALYIIFFFSLHRYTKHGEEVILPGVTGMTIHAASSQLEYLGFTVDVDSIYEPSAKPFTVLKQTPDSGSVVKEGRTVFLMVNMQVPPSVPMPNLVGISFSSAQMLLRTNKLSLGDTIHKPFEKSGIILEQYYRGFPVKAGQAIAQGSKITLYVGDGNGETEHQMPDVLNINCEMAQAILSQLDLRIVLKPRTEATRIADTSRSIVVEQFPKPDALIKAGDSILLTIE